VRAPDNESQVSARDRITTVLPAHIERFTREWNAGATLFKWVKTADEILAKAGRKTQADSGARHEVATAAIRRRGLPHRTRVGDLQESAANRSRATIGAGVPAATPPAS